MVNKATYVEIAHLSPEVIIRVVQAPIIIVVDVTMVKVITNDH